MSSVLEFKGISKYFPGVKALDDINFKAYGGEVLAFLGENGAGKSTLLKVLNGDYQPTKGEYWLNGEQKHFSSPHEAIEEGISIIYQERQILLELSVAENIYLGRMPANGLGVIDTRKANRMAAEIIKDFGLPIQPTTKVKDLSIAYQQMVEIMKAYSRENLKVICFDEPTASLSDAEIDALFAVIRKLKSEGKIIIYVSHRMAEIQEIADKVAIFKDGRYVDTVTVGEVTEAEMIRMMVGRDLGDIFADLKRNDKIGDVLLEVKGVSSDYVKDNSFVLHKGEVLGFSGLVGAGRTELMRAIIGADPMKSGEVILEGKKIVNRSPKEAMDNGIVLVPEDRKLQGILSNLSVAGNINIALMDKHSNGLGVISVKQETEAADNRRRREIRVLQHDLRVRAGGPRRDPDLFGDAGGHRPFRQNPGHEVAPDRRRGEPGGRHGRQAAESWNDGGRINGKQERKERFLKSDRRRQDHPARRHRAGICAVHHSQ